MAKSKTVYTCQKCGYTAAKWLGRCPDCAAWDSLAEVREEEGGTAGESDRWLTRRRGAANTPGPVSPLLSTEDPIASRPQTLAEILPVAGSCFKTGLAGLDALLGGGVVPGAVVLIGGDPGIGKSTLLLQAFGALPAKRRVLYVSGEESAGQIKQRADRLQIASDGLYLLAETALEEMLRHAEAIAPEVIVIDSIQTVYTRTLTAAPGSVTQIREAALQLMFFAKQSNTAIFIIGHVTKDGVLAGPRLLEHMVDTVLYFEADRSHAYRVLRAVKNRFGAVGEMGIFEMRGTGLAGVDNPSGLFLSDRGAKGASGAVVAACAQGARPLLVELQALVTPSYLGTARRTASGVDSNRLSLIIAVLEKRARLHLAGQDVFVNVVSGIEIDEPAMDLGLVLAIASSLRDRPAPSDMVVFGEIDLLGEVRPVPHPKNRVLEAQKLRFTRCMLPVKNKAVIEREAGSVRDIELIGVSHIAEALQWG